MDFGTGAKNFMDAVIAQKNNQAPDTSSTATPVSSNFASNAKQFMNTAINSIPLANEAGTQNSTSGNAISGTAQSLGLLGAGKPYSSNNNNSYLA